MFYDLFFTDHPSRVGGAHGTGVADRVWGALYHVLPRADEQLEVWLLLASLTEVLSKVLSFGEFQTLLRQTGWVMDHQKGSHRIWYSPRGCRLSVQEGRSGKAKGYQVEHFLRKYEVENEKV